MPAAIGADLVQVSRIRRMFERFPHQCASKVFTPAEMQTCLSRPVPERALAGRFAAKEAVMKALGTGWARGIRFIDIEVSADTEDRPGVSLTGVDADRAHQNATNPPITRKRAISIQGRTNRRRGLWSSEAPQKKHVCAR